MVAIVLLYLVLATLCHQKAKGTAVIPLRTIVIAMFWLKNVRIINIETGEKCSKWDHFLDLPKVAFLTPPVRDFALKEAISFFLPIYREREQIERVYAHASGWWNRGVGGGFVNRSASISVPRRYRTSMWPFDIWSWRWWWRMSIYLRRFVGAALFATKTANLLSI